MGGDKLLIVINRLQLGDFSDFLSTSCEVNMTFLENESCKIYNFTCTCACMIIIDNYINI